MSMRNRLFLLIFLAVLILGSLAIAWWYKEGGPVRLPGAEEYVLILGLDEFGESRRSDSILVAKLEEQAVKVLFIPRDLRVKFPDGTLDKLNVAYAKGGVELTRRIVAEILGLPIQRYAVVNYQGFTSFIDALGGVTVNIEKPMRYDDEKQGLHINLPAGTRTLMGKEALDFWRYRDAATGEDLGRIGRQQQFLKALVQKLPQVPKSQMRRLVETALQHVQTNLAAVDVYRLVERLQKLSPQDLKLAVLPGGPVLINKVSYFQARPVEMAALVEEFFHGQQVLTNKDVKVIVLNGHPDEVKRQGLAKKVSDLLRSQGFQVLAYWNAGDTFDYPQSFLINISGEEQKAQRLANALKPSSLKVMSVEEFTAWSNERFGEDRWSMIRKLLLTTAVPPLDRGVELSEADLVLILGEGFPTGGEQS